VRTLSDGGVGGVRDGVGGHGGGWGVALPFGDPVGLVFVGQRAPLPLRRPGGFLWGLFGKAGDWAPERNGGKGRRGG
jgi:hypothetical protein